MRTTSWLQHLMTAPLLVLLSLSPAIAAEPDKHSTGSPKDEAFDDVARKLFRDGNKAMDQQQWEQCRAAFTAAWNIKKQYQIAGNLAVCEAKLGFYRDAAEHLRYFLREIPKESPPERKKMGEALVEEVRKKVALMAVFVNIAGAEVLVDGVSIGRSPLAEPFFVEAGMHTVVAQFAGYPSAKHVVDAAAGSQHQVTLDLRAPSPEPDTSQNNPSEPVKGPVTQPPLVAEKPKLPVHKIVIGTGVATGIILLATGVAFTIIANQKASEAGSLLASLKKATPGVPPCPTGKSGADCDKLFEQRSGQTDATNAAISTYLVGGTISAGTLIYAIIQMKHQSSPSLQPLPMIGSGNAGLVIRGQW